MAAARKEFVAPEVKEVEKGEGSLPGLMGTGMSVKEKYAERMKKLRDLHMKRNEARKMNHQEVVEEDRRNKEPKNMEARKKRAEYVLKEVSLNHQITKVLHTNDYIFLNPTCTYYNCILTA